MAEVSAGAMFVFSLLSVRFRRVKKNVGNSNSNQTHNIGMWWYLPQKIRQMSCAKLHNLSDETYTIA